MDFYESPDQLLEAKKEEISKEINSFINEAYPLGKPMHVEEARFAIMYQSLMTLSKHFPFKLIPNVVVDIDNIGRIDVRFGKCPDFIPDPKVVN